jgi:predicted nucleotidyltransferase
MANAPTTREDVLARMRDQHAAMRSLGVQRLALFGSIARNQGTAHSDIDLLVEFEPRRKSYDAWLRLVELLESALGRPVDLVTLERLSPFIGPHILAEAVDVLRAA